MEKLYHIKQSIFRYNSQLTRKYTLQSLIKLVVAIDLTTHSTHYYQRLNQCHLRLDGHGNMVKDHSDNKRWNNWMGAPRQINLMTHCTMSQGFTTNIWVTDRDNYQTDHGSVVLLFHWAVLYPAHWFGQRENSIVHTQTIFNNSYTGIK